MPEIMNLRGRWYFKPAGVPSQMREEPRHIWDNVVRCVFGGGVGGMGEEPGGGGEKTGTIRRLKMTKYIKGGDVGLWLRRKQPFCGEGGKASAKIVEGRRICGTCESEPVAAEENAALGVPNR